MIKQPQQPDHITPSRAFQDIPQDLRNTKLLFLIEHRNRQKTTPYQNMKLLNCYKYTTIKIQENSRYSEKIHLCPHTCVNRFFEKIEGGLQVLGYCGFGLGVS